MDNAVVTIVLLRFLLAGLAPEPEEKLRRSEPWQRPNHLTVALEALTEVLLEARIRSGSSVSSTKALVNVYAVKERTVSTKEWPQHASRHAQRGL